MISKVKDVMTLMLSGKEKIYFLLNRIDDAKAITPAGQPLIIDPTNDLNQNYRDIELAQLFTKLAKDEQILKILKVPSRTKEIDIVEDLDPYDHADDGCWHIELLPKFDEYYSKIQHEKEYQAFTGEEPDSDEYKESQFALRPTVFFGGKILSTQSASAKKIASEFSEQNRAFVIRVLKDIVSSIDFSDDGKVPYQLKSPAGVDIINERKLLRKLASFGLFRSLGEDDIFGIATLSDLNVKLINDVISCLDALDTGLYSREEFREVEENEKEGTSEKPATETPLWQDDFHWEGKKFVFGSYGRTPNFNSKERKHLFKELTDARGAWVSVKKLRQVTDKGNDYVRPTIGQIERSFSKNLRTFISIPSTKENDLQPKPQEGAYRIKFIQKPL